ICCIAHLYVVYLVSFFFSSRRRHTRFSRDWSSDVCSSDLYWLDEERRLLELPLTTVFWGLLRRQGDALYPALWRTPRLRGLLARSEERRVGKECRSRRLSARQKKNQKGTDRSADQSSIQSN